MEEFQAPCEKCGGTCCRYVAIEIDRPKTKQDFDHIRWYLLHRDVHVFIDHEKKWYVEFRTTCDEQLKDNRCGIYDRRPKICREHGIAEGECEYYDTPYQEYFSHEDDFLKYLVEHKKEWEFKRLK